MNQLDRRQWLKTIGLSGSFALLGGMESLAMQFPPLPSMAGVPVRLNANENPYGPSKAVRETLKATFDEACRYPFASLPGLVQMIAAREGVPTESVVVTGGSTEGLKAAGLVYGLAGGEIIAADPTFQVLLHYAEQFGAYVHRVPLNDKLEHDLDAMSKRVTDKTRLIFLCNPNNPSGTIIEKNRLRDFCESHEGRTLIFSDEAYYDFIMEADYPSMIELVKEGRNIIVSKTFSKVFGLAGLRIGYLVARPDIATRLNEAVMANTNTLAIAAAMEALKDREFYKYSLVRNTEAKSIIYQTLDKLQLPYIKSHTNFVFFKSGRPIQELVKAMEGEQVLIGRPFPPLLNWARISTGTVENMQAFSGALSKVMKA